MNITTSHIEQEKVKIELSELRNVGEIEYRTLDLGIFTSVTLTPEQADELFNVLDKGLHENTYTDLEDRCLNLESDLVAANELIEELEDRIQDNYK